MGKPRKPGTKPEARAAAKIRGSFAPPATLTPAGRKHWIKTFETLSEAGHLADTDFDAMHLYVATWERWQEAEAGVREFGLVLEGPNGTPYISPHAKLSQACVKELRSLADSLGMTPASRARMRIEKPDPDGDKWSFLD
jgi:P27 family predicted phage terminase small subunit